jgi:hypothetical protein
MTGLSAQLSLESLGHVSQFHQRRCRRHSRKTYPQGILGNAFQDLDHFQTEHAVGARPPAAGAAFDEVVDFDQ